MYESYRLEQAAMADEKVKEYRAAMDTAVKYSDEWREAAQWLEFWQNKSTFLWAMRLHTEKGSNGRL
jgi:hypothetical protein